MPQPCIASNRTLIAGQPAVVVTSPTWRLVLLPTLGARIWELEYRPKAVQFLWHNSAVPPQPVSLGAGYDEVWSGGWDEIFPADAPYTHGGKQFPDHGEFWSIEWQYEVAHERDALILHLWSFGPVTRARFDKWIRIPTTDSAIRIRYRVVNHGAEFPFLFKLHPALQVNERSRIVLPPCRFVPDSEFSTWFPAPGEVFSWPHACKPDGSPVDLRTVPSPEAKATLFGYATELTHGFCGIIYPDKQVGFGLAFPLEVLPSCWIFASYGGFRGHHVVVLEPCTSSHWRLEQCVANGLARRFLAHASFETSVLVSAFEAASEDAASQWLRNIASNLPGFA